jgi:hypothetical protein
MTAKKTLPSLAYNLIQILPITSSNVKRLHGLDHLRAVAIVLDLNG